MISSGGVWDPETKCFVAQRKCGFQEQEGKGREDEPSQWHRRRRVCAHSFRRCKYMQRMQPVGFQSQPRCSPSPVDVQLIDDGNGLQMYRSCTTGNATRVQGCTSVSAGCWPSQRTVHMNPGARRRVHVHAHCCIETCCAEWHKVSCLRVRLLGFLFSEYASPSHLHIMGCGGGK